MVLTRERAIELTSKPAPSLEGVGKRWQCPICQRFTVKVAHNGHTQCPTCLRRWEAEAKRKREACRLASPWKWLTWKGCTVAVYLSGDGPNPRCTASTMWHGEIPKSRLINLDVWQKGYTREQIKRLKAIVLDTFRREIHLA